MMNIYFPSGSLDLGICQAESAPIKNTREGVSSEHPCFATFHSYCLKSLLGELSTCYMDPLERTLGSLQLVHFFPLLTVLDILLLQGITIMSTTTLWIMTAILPVQVPQCCLTFLIKAILVHIQRPPRLTYVLVIFEVPCSAQNYGAALQAAPSRACCCPTAVSFPAAGALWLCASQQYVLRSTSWDADTSPTSRSPRQSSDSSRIVPFLEIPSQSFPFLRGTPSLFLSDN